MIDIQIILDKLSSDLLYTVELSRDREPNLQEIVELPIIYVAYSSEQMANPNAPIAYDIYSEHGEDIIQTFEIKIVSTISDFYLVWREVYKSLIGYTPTPTLASIASTSGMTYRQGAVMGLSNGKLWHLALWNIGFPTTNVLF
jgi:hypothetical protein